MAERPYLQREWPLEQQKDYIRKLPLWKSPITLEPLPGGIQNRNFVAQDGNTKYVVRVAGDLLNIGGVLSSTNAAVEVASACGVSPKLVYQEPVLSVVEWINGRNLTIEDFTRRETIAPVVDLIKRLQAASETVRWAMVYFDPFFQTRQSARMCAHLKARGHEAYTPLVTVLERLERHFGPFKPVLAHCDLAYVNTMLDVSGRYWLIDYDLAGLGPPEWDIAELAGYSYTSDEIDREFVRCYFGDGSEADVERHVLRHRAYKITSLIRVIYLLLILDASCGVSAEELKASMGKNFENVGGDYLEFARTHYEFFRKEWARYGDTF